MTISLVAAASSNNTIGLNNQLIWHLPNDMQFFKNLTWGMPVIMGRKTFESINNKPLPGRCNIVVSHKLSKVQHTHVTIANTLPEAIAIAGATDAKEVFVVGGAEIYAAALPMANKMYITRIHAQIKGDTFFPVFDKEEWLKIKNQNFLADEKHTYPYSFEVWQRNN
jgi:dihydrofolate reductase